jgi:hypothetical protein
MHFVRSRPARVGDNLVTQSFAATTTHGFAGAEEPGVAVCLLPGTELAFQKDVEWYRPFRLFRRKLPSGKLVRFRQINLDKPYTHHDAIEFANGTVILLTNLCEGQKATVLQLPVSSTADQRKQFAESETGAQVIDLVPVRPDRSEWRFESFYV